MANWLVVDQFEFGCAPQVAPDATASPCWLLLRVYRQPVRAALRFGGRSVLNGKKVAIFSAYSSARHQSSAIFPELAAPGNAQLSPDACPSPRRQSADRSYDNKILRDMALPRFKLIH
jgi:hypothetical protein